MKVKYTGETVHDLTHGKIYDVLEELGDRVVVIDDVGDEHEVFEDEFVEDSPVEWDGEGLPPVGTVCEVSNCGNPWVSCEILFVGSALCVVKHNNVREQHYHLISVKFRPIKSEYDKFSEELQKDIRMKTMFGLSEKAVKALYELGYRKQS